MGYCPSSFACCFLDIPNALGRWFYQAMGTVQKGFRPHTRAQYIKQFKLFVAFMLQYKCKKWDSVSSVLCFLEFLAANALTFRVINNYMSALKHHFARYSWGIDVFESPLVRKFLRGLQYTVPPNPQPKGLFSLNQIHEISQLCESFESSLTYRAAYLLAFYGLFRISNLAPVSSTQFDKKRHLLQSDITFAPPGVHIKIKWAKNIQAPEKIHFVKLPTIRVANMCPVKTLAALLKKFCLQPDDPLLVLDDYHLLTQSNLRSRLATFLRTMGVPLQAHGFHTFRHSAATIAYDANASLSAIKSHGLWSSDAVWCYISDNTSQALQVPLTFQHLVNTTFS